MATDIRTWSEACCVELARKAPWDVVVVEANEPVGGLDEGGHRIYLNHDGDLGHEVSFEHYDEALEFADVAEGYVEEVKVCQAETLKAAKTTISEDRHS